MSHPPFFLGRISRAGLAVFDIVNDLRLHVLFNYFLVVSWFLRSSKVSIQDSVDYAFVALSMATFAYLLNRYADYHYDLIADAGLKKAPRSLYVVISLASLAAATLFLIQRPSHMLPLVVGLVFGVLYSVKTIFPLPLKNYWFTKNLLAVSSKYLVTFGGVLLFVPFTETLFIRSISMLVFYFIYEMLWDIRDMVADKVGRVTTIPILIGRKKTLLLCSFIGFSSLVLQVGVLNTTVYFYLKYIAVFFFIVSLIGVRHPRWFHAMTYVHLVLNLIFQSNDEIFHYAWNAISFF